MNGEQLTLDPVATVRGRCKLCGHRGPHEIIHRGAARCSGCHAGLTIPTGLAA